MESNCNIIKLYCFNVNSYNGYEYSYERKILTICKRKPEVNNKKLSLDIEKNVFTNILYCFTTICAFLSLIFSGIKPIIDFGWMMTVGLLVSMIVTFTLLPVSLVF